MTRLDHALSAYQADERPPLCPRCGGWDGPRLPFCTDDGWSHRGTCATYSFSDDLCAACDDETRPAHHHPAASTEESTK